MMIVYLKCCCACSIVLVKKYLFWKDVTMQGVEIA